MSYGEARRFLIISSLGITGFQLVFLIIAPVAGYPLEYPQNLDLLQITLPVFLGYLGSAAHFVFQSPGRADTDKNDYLALLLKGPIVIYVVAVSSALFAFGYSNRVGAQPGSGISVDHLATTLTVCLGLLAVTTSVLSSYLFANPQSVSNE